MHSFIVTVIVLYLMLLAMMYVMQRKMLYVPDTVINAPETYGLTGYHDIRTQTTDNFTIQMWHREAAEGFPTVVYVHGNGGNIAARSAIYSALANKGFGILGVSYRGYGKSEGFPSEEGLYNDARAAIAYLMKERDLPAKRILLFGESLGTGIATQMATEYDVGALILQAPYTSVLNRASEIHYYIPVRLLLKDRFDSISKIANVKAPVLLFHGELDQTIPVTHGRALLDKVVSPKKAYFFPEVAHNDFDSETLATHILEFANEHGLINGAK